MSDLAITNSFSAGDAIVASQMNTNFTDVTTWANGAPNIGVSGSTATMDGALTVTEALTASSTSQFNGTVTVGVDGTGKDVKFFGDTAAKYMLWDESEDRLEVAGTVKQDGVIGRIAPTGVVLPFAGGSIPTGWLLCTGGAVSRTTYANLFAVISTTYGVGDGSTTFNVPDMQGRVPAGVNTGDANFVSLNTKVGSATHTLTSGEMPSHTHTQNSHLHYIWHTAYGYIGTVAGTFGAIINRDAIGDNVGGLWTATATTAVNQNTGGGGAHNNLQPTIALYYIIAT